MESKCTLSYRKTWDKYEVFTGVLFVLPSLIMWIYWFLFPAVKSMRLSLYEYSYINPNQETFVGLANFIRLFHDREFLDALKHSFTLVFFVVIIISFLSLFVALLLQGEVRGKAFFRTVYYMPYVISAVAVSIFFMYLFIKDGPVTRFLAIFGLKNTTWFTNPQYALQLIMIIYIWQQIGFYMILYISGLQSISEELYEAARIDGATYLQSTQYITLPLLKPTTYLVLTLCMINAFQIFDQIAAISKQSPLGSPAGSTSTVVTFLYRHSFSYLDMGYGSAAAMVLFVLIFTLSLLRMLISKEN